MRSLFERRSRSTTTCEPFDTANAATPSDLPGAPDGDVDVDHSRVVLNVGFTGDLDRHRAELRTPWRGPPSVVLERRYGKGVVELVRQLHEVR